MKEAELRKHANCSRCKKKIGESGYPVFAVLRQKNYIINVAAVQRQTGLGLMPGHLAVGAGLAMHMGPDEDLAIEVPEAVDLTLCALCRAHFEEWLDEV